MRSSTMAAALAASGVAVAQRPMNMSICDYYTTALLKDNNATNQYTLLTLVVNTAVIGNYTMPNVGISVPGILAKGTYNGTEVNLLPYFNGALKSTNRNGSAVALNFLDDGGAAPLMKNMPANGESSAQYRLLTGLYKYFGALLQCSAHDYPQYMGPGSQAAIHRYMDLDSAEVGWFIQQVGLSAASFGVAKEDVQAVGTALSTLFNVRCAAPAVVIPSQGAQLQSICLADDCALAPNNTCSAYPAEMKPAVANATLNGGSTVAGGNGSMTGSATGSSSSAKSTVAMGSGAGRVGVELAVAGAFALAALAL